MEDPCHVIRHVDGIPAQAAHFDKETLTMSDQDRDRLPMSEDEDSDDVQAHLLDRGQYSTRGADEDSSDDVEAHKLL
jgi:hypothetical protein